MQIGLDPWLHCFYECTVVGIKRKFCSKIINLPICAGAKVFTIAKIALELQRLLWIQPIFSQIDILIFDRLCEKVHINQKTFSIFGSLSLWDLMTDKKE